MNPPPPDGRDRDSMLDLPLRPGDHQPELPFGPDELRPEKPMEGPAVPPPSPPPRRHARPPVNRGRLFGIIVLVAVLLVSAYLIFWPKPPEAAFSADPFVLEKVRLGETGELQTLTITNVGERPMPIGVLGLVGDNAGEFVMEEDGCGAVLLQAEESCSVLLRFSPAAMGQRQTVLELQAEMPDSPARLAIVGEGTAPVMAVAPASAGFGAQDVGTASTPLDLVVSNEGTAALRVSRVSLSGVAERDYRLTRNDCSKSTLTPGETCALRLVFVPRAAGPRQAELVMESDALEPVPTVDLVGEGIWTGAAFAVEPRSVDFGRHLVGTDKLRKSVQVINRQGTALQSIRVGLSETDRGFKLGKQTCTGKALAPGESCRVEVEFSANGEGEFNSLLQISQRDVGTLGIELRGKGAAPRWVLARNSLEFGDVRVGESGPTQQVEVRNEGSAGSRVEKVEVGGEDASGFAIADDACSRREIEPGSGCSLLVQFVPRREGVHEGEVHLRMAAGVSPQRVVLNARAVAPRLSLDRETVDFDSVRRTTMRQVELQLANRGTASLKLGPFSVEDNPTGDFRIVTGSCRQSIVLAAGERCTIGVTFGPTQEGRSTARLQIVHDGISGPHDLPLAGVGLPAPIPKLVLDDSNLDFGPQPLGVRSTIQTVNIEAGGTGNLELREFSLEGANEADFHIVPATCHAGPSLQPGSSCAVGLRFLPLAPGPRSARLVFRHNAGSGADSIELRGEGLGGPPG